MLLYMETNKPFPNMQSLQEADIERLMRLAEWGELIHKDLGEFLGSLDRLLLEKTNEGKPPTRDFLMNYKKTVGRG